MGASREDIEGWFKEGKRQRATHMIVVCDTFDYGDYPVYVKGGEEKARKKHAEYEERRHAMQRVMEVYYLAGDMKAQLDQRRCFNFGPVEVPKSAGKPPATSIKKTEFEALLERLAVLSKDAQRNVSGDIPHTAGQAEWDVKKLRKVIDSTRALSNEVDRFIAGVVSGALSTVRRPEDYQGLSPSLEPTVVVARRETENVLVELPRLDLEKFARELERKKRARRLLRKP